MATLFLARRKGAAGFQRHVAVKVVHSNFLDDERIVNMLIAEAKVSARIKHPNVIHIEEFNEDQGVFFMAMEYLHGCSIAELLNALAGRGLKLSSDLVAHIEIKLAAGLHAAHETCDEEGKPLDLVHRDVSPQSVLLGYRGIVKLIDFGFAKSRSSAYLTRGLSLKGKIRYMAPEQATGKGVDRRTDV